MNFKKIPNPQKEISSMINELFSMPSLTAREVQYRKQPAANLSSGHLIPSELYPAISTPCARPANIIENQEVCCTCSDTFTLSTIHPSGTVQMWWLTTPVAAVDKLWHFHRPPIIHFALGHFYWPCLCDIFTCDQWPAEHLINRTRTGSCKGFLMLLVDGGCDKCSLRSSW